MEGLKWSKRYRASVGIAEIARLLYGHIIPMAAHNAVKALEMFRLLVLSLPNEVRTKVIAAMEAVPDPRQTGELQQIYATYLEGLIGEAEYESIAAEYHSKKVLQAGLFALSEWLEQALLKAETYVIGVGGEEE